MDTEAGLLTLLCERWEEARGRGVELAPEELCRDHPELLDEVRAAVRGLRAADRLAAGPEPTRSAVTRTGPRLRTCRPCRPGAGTG